MSGLRIGVVHWTARHVGGAEQYVSTVVPLLRRAGHQVALLAELDEPSGGARLVGDEVPVWFVSEEGLEGAIERLRGWRPDVLFNQMVLDPRLEESILDVAPAVLFTHGYAGICISGTKTTCAPELRTCERTFGYTCLLNFYPRRCGGLSPLTMVRDFRTQRARSALLSRYAAVVTNSEYVRGEYVRNGCEPGRVFAVPLPVRDVGNAPPDMFSPEIDGEGPRRLLFVGRMDRLKGGLQLLESLWGVRKRLASPIHVVLAGDGPERLRWEERASAVASGEGGIRIEFPGRVDATEVAALYRWAEVLVVPSLWPEPFGMVGPEAGCHGVPAAAFASGGIVEWLQDGVNGHLAAAERTPAALGEAIVRCLANPAHHRQLRQGAVALAARYSEAAHAAALLPILERTARGH